MTNIKTQRLFLSLSLSLPISLSLFLSLSFSFSLFFFLSLSMILFSFCSFSLHLARTTILPSFVFLNVVSSQSLIYSLVLFNFLFLSLSPSQLCKQRNNPIASFCHSAYPPRLGK